MTSSLRALLPACLLALVAAGPLGAAPDEPAAPPDARAVPKLGELNRYVLKVADGYPTDGTHRYNWPKDGSYSGVTEDLLYRGECVAKGNEKKETYCCGLTFEVLFRAWEAWSAAKRREFTIGGLDAGGVKKLRGDWFCANGVREGPVKALVSRGLGVQVERLEDARPGDFVQLWRQSGSGHSVIFLAWERDRSGEITALRYWSTQGATNGIGVRVERFTGKSGLKRDELYIARVGR